MVAFGTAAPPETGTSESCGVHPRHDVDHGAVVRPDGVEVVRRRAELTDCRARGDLARYGSVRLINHASGRKSSSGKLMDLRISRYWP